MKIYYPKYYEDFHCIASSCPDSCCKEWSVDVDEKSAAFYRSIDGELGDRLRQVLQDTDDGTIMAIENGRCPMWQQNGLCRIQAELGHEALCQVCREFPRLRHDYGNLAELGLELSCPEAARLILENENPEWVVRSEAGNSPAEYDTATMDTLLRSRMEFLRFLQVTALPFPQILAVLLIYAHDVQEELDGGAKAALDPDNCLSCGMRFAQAGNFSLLQNFFSELEILTPQWKNRLCSPIVHPQWDNRYRALLRYFIDRYWLQAVSDFDLLCRGKFSVAACLLIAYLGGDLLETAQLFSKEIENDPDNVDAILDGAYTSPALTDSNLLGLLLM